MQWSEVLAEPTLRDLPFKIELNQWGVIEMSPASTWHGRRQGNISRYLNRKLSTGTVWGVVGVRTVLGVRVPDVMWSSDAFDAQHGNESPLPLAPELCVEVLSESNTDAEMAGKRAAYFAAGAQEVWLVAIDSTITVYTRDGMCAVSNIVGEVPTLNT
jgi:Uma2 family endonuclease